MHNPLGFGDADFIELALALCLAALYFLHPVVEPHIRRLAKHTGWSMLALFVLPIALRLVLLPHFPVPTPAGSDDFSHLLVADTLRHFRLANPAHPFHRFFEEIFVLQEPTYSSMYPPGQGMVLALGKLLFGTPWAGVLIADGAFCALSYWMLTGWLDPAWAFAGGLLAVAEFGPLNQWANTYWTTALPAIAGCLVFGTLPRLGQKRMGVVLGLGLALHLITRPFEFLVLCGCTLLYGWREWRALRSATVVLIPAVLLLLVQNKSVTGSWTTLPYQLSQYEYGIPTSFAFQPNPIPHRPLTPEQDLNYRAGVAIHGDQPETIGTYLQRLVFAIRYYRFFVLPPLYLALLAFVVKNRDRQHRWIIAFVALFILIENLYPYFYPHYVGATACLFVLMSMAGLRRLNRWNVGRLLYFLSLASFLCWYGIRLSGQESLFPALAYDDGDFVNHGDPEGRIAINRQLAQSPGRQLVFVHYSPAHKFHEWIHNDADIDAARVVWALDLGEEENKKLIAHYPDRQVWIVEPDAQPPRLEPLSY